MFCHNCGKDCGDFKFCPHCGTQVKSDATKTAVEAVWTVGKPCPQCGGTEISNGRCAFCGVQLLAADQLRNGSRADASIELPCGIYKGFDGTLTLYEKECVIHRRVSWFKTCETVIPYDKITAVVYVRKALSISFLLFRWEGNKDRPIPPISGFGKDSTVITSSQSIRPLFFSTDKEMHIDEVCEDLLFYHIFHALKEIVPKSAEFRMEVLPSGVAGIDELALKTEIGYYFEEYAPFRDQAVEAVRKRTGAKEDVAKALINQHFDAQEEKLYAQDHTAALKDLNLIVTEKKRREELAKKRSDEQHERVYRNSLLDDLHRDNRD